jgi:hypothetical protein
LDTEPRNGFSVGGSCTTNNYFVRHWFECSATASYFWRGASTPGLARTTL